MSEQKAINSRYSELATQSCCLSCVGAIDYAKVKPGEMCLDLGSGRGSDVLRLAGEVGEEGFVWGLDISDGMLDEARKKADKLAIGNVDFVKSDLETIPLPDESVDLVISNCTINHAHNKHRVWREIYRSLKKNGRFVVSDIFSSEEVPVEYAEDPQAIAECWAGSVTKDVYLHTLKGCGFSDINIIEESEPYTKGKIEVSSFTITARKPCCTCN